MHIEDKVTPDTSLMMGSLLQHASGNTVVLNALNCYDPVKADSTNCKNLNEKVSRDHLNVLASFVNIRNAEDKIVFPKATVLIKAIVWRLNQLKPSNCSECTEVYRVDLSDTPLLECHMCGRGAHNCEQISAALSDQKECLDANLSKSLAHMVWLCSCCYHSVNPIPRSSLFNSLCATPATKHTTPSERELGVKSLLSKAILITEHISKTQKEDENDEVVVVESDSKETERVEEVERVSKETDGSGEEVDDRPVCRAFSEWSCQHGLMGNKLIKGRKCPDRHPLACKKYLKFGTTENGCSVTDCELFHPKLCRFIQSEASCFDVKCKSYHPFSFNKLRRAAIKAKASRDKSSAAETVNKRNDKTRNKKKPTVERSHERKKNGSNSDSSDFRKLQDLISKLIGRVDSLEKRFEETPRERMMSSDPINPSQFQKVPLPQPSFMNPWQAWNAPRQFAQPACY